MMGDDDDLEQGGEADLENKYFMAKSKSITRIRGAQYEIAAG